MKGIAIAKCCKVYSCLEKVYQKITEKTSRDNLGK